MVEISKDPTPSRGSLGLLNQTLNPWGEAFWETLSRSLFLYLIVKIRGGFHSEILQVWKHPPKTNMEPPLKLVGLCIDVYFLFQLIGYFQVHALVRGVGGRSPKHFREILVLRPSCRHLSTEPCHTFIARPIPPMHSWSEDAWHLFWDLRDGRVRASQIAFIFLGVLGMKKKGHITIYKSIVIRNRCGYYRYISWKMICLWCAVNVKLEKPPVLYHTTLQDSCDHQRAVDTLW